jgi:hypothetical protein
VTLLRTRLGRCKLTPKPRLWWCGWCGRAVPLGRRSWCSDWCKASFWANHNWPLAREEAIHQAAVRLGLPLRSLPTDGLNLCEWPDGCDGDGGRHEVHHIKPVNARRETGCQHHQANLMVLCQAHHVTAGVILRSGGRVTRTKIIAPREVAV